jgi:hypothetical protein
MDHTRGVTGTAERQVAHRATDCPDCGNPSPRLPPVSTPLLGSVSLRRCLRCGRRYTCEPKPRRLRVCPRCRLPHLGGNDADGRCAGCLAGDVAVGSPDGSLPRAAEGELQARLASEWEFVGAEPTQRYLETVLREVAERIPDSPVGGRVLLVPEGAVHSLALPSGTVILSVGALAAIEDGAELAFVLGHELAHVAAGDAAATLVRIGLQELMSEAEEDRERAWSHAAIDLIRLGHGDRAEHEADATALSAMVLLGYDPAAAARYLERLRVRTERGEVEVADDALAHPPAADRSRRIEGLRSVSLRAALADRVDREVFRRVAGHSVLGKGLQKVRPFGADDEPRRVVIRVRPRAALVWVAVGLAAIVALALIYWLA